MSEILELSGVSWLGSDVKEAALKGIFHHSQ